MIRTTLMVDQYEDRHKTFSHLDIAKKSSKRLTLANRFNMVRDLSSKTGSLFRFDVPNTQSHLVKPNEIFHLTHVVGNVNLVLPRASKMNDWIVLFYDQDQVLRDVETEAHSLIKVYGNGERIMGYDEPLVCDVPFMSLRLTYVNKIDGWIIT
jgi:hypothetical protein